MNYNRKCTKDYWERILIPIFYSLFLVLIFIFTTADSLPKRVGGSGKKKGCCKQCLIKCTKPLICVWKSYKECAKANFPKGYEIFLKTIINRQLAYYFQAVTVIFGSGILFKLNI